MGGLMDDQNDHFKYGFESSEAFFGYVKFGLKWGEASPFSKLLYVTRFLN